MKIARRLTGKKSVRMLIRIYQPLFSDSKLQPSERAMRKQ